VLDGELGSSEDGVNGHGHEETLWHQATSELEGRLRD
jgi:hypothetical protein